MSNEILNNSVIYPLGIDYSTKELLFEPIKQKTFVEGLIEGLKQTSESLRTRSALTARGDTFRSEIERDTIDIANPREAGWTFVINKNDPRKDQIIESMEPLARHRGMQDPFSPLLFYGESEEDWIEWIQEEYEIFDLEPGKKVPHYVLIVGSPDKIPFYFQALLDVTASVGRIDFDSLEDLDNYIEKIIRLEKSESPIVKDETTFFATNHGQTPRGIDPTHFSHNFMVRPLAKHVHEDLHFNITEIYEEEATKDKLLNSLKNSKSAMVYTASHGSGAKGNTLEEQKRITGAICCQNFHQPDDAGIITIDDIPANEPFLEGSVFFQFACFGYGTPKESDLNHLMFNGNEWGLPKQIAQESFVSSIPKRLLANPHGPIAFIGHVDMALLHGFTDPSSPYPLDEWSPRIRPFKKAIDEILNIMPIGLAMTDMNSKYNQENARITRMYDRLKRNRITNMTDFEIKLSESFLNRTDAQNYMVFGDPATHLRISRD